MAEQALWEFDCDGSGGGDITVDTDRAPTEESVERLPDL